MIYYIGIDVGTQSVRSSIVTEGQTVSTATNPLTVYNPKPDHYEQSCDEIWDGIVSTFAKLKESVSPEVWSNVRGIGCDATCSMVVCDKHGNPLSISASGTPGRTCLLWMDHRATTQTKLINESCQTHYPLRYVGGKFSPEQQPPKLMWIRENLPHVWSEAGHFFDLADWLTFKLTGSAIRSECTVTCKWGYVRSLGGWSKEFLSSIGLSDLVSLEKIGDKVITVGSCVGEVNEDIASELNVSTETIVAVPMIDAHVGTLAMLQYSSDEISESLGIISGTSSCVMGLCKLQTCIPGVWGPYQDVVVPGMWLYEGGQTAAGSSLDHIIRSHSAYAPDMTYEKLNNDLMLLADSEHEVHTLTKDMHIQPDLHGNRSPLALPWLRGTIFGLNLSSDYTNLLHIYLATIQGLCCGIMMIIEAMVAKGLQFSQIVMCGGLAANSLYIRTLASVTRLPIVVPNETNLMCVGSRSAC